MAGTPKKRRFDKTRTFMGKAAKNTAWGAWEAAKWSGKKAGKGAQKAWNSPGVKKVRSDVATTVNEGITKASTGAMGTPEKRAKMRTRAGWVGAGAAGGMALGATLGAPLWIGVPAGLAALYGWKEHATPASRKQIKQYSTGALLGGIALAPYFGIPLGLGALFGAGAVHLGKRGQEALSRYKEYYKMTGLTEKNYLQQVLKDAAHPVKSVRRTWQEVGRAREMTWPGLKALSVLPKKIRDRYTKSVWNQVFFGNEEAERAELKGLQQEAADFMRGPDRDAKLLGRIPKIQERIAFLQTVQAARKQSGSYFKTYFAEQLVSSLRGTQLSRGALDRLRREYGDTVLLWTFSHSAKEIMLEHERIQHEMNGLLDPKTGTIKDLSHMDQYYRLRRDFAFINAASAARKEIYDRLERADARRVNPADTDATIARSAIDDSLRRAKALRNVPLSRLSPQAANIYLRNPLNNLQRERLDTLIGRVISGWRKHPPLAPGEKITAKRMQKLIELAKRGVNKPARTGP